MRLLRAILSLLARRKLDHLHMNQQLAGTTHTAETHPLRTGYAQRVKDKGL
jgi:hypothetical protein